MRVCILRHAYFPDDPRDRKQAFALMQAGHPVDVLCLRKKKQSFHEVVNGVRIYRLPLVHKRGGVVRYFAEYATSFIMMSVALSYLFVRNRYHCIQVGTMPDFLVFVTIIPKLFKSNVLLDLHEPTPELWVTKYGPKRLRWLLKFQMIIEQLSIRYADQGLVVTESLRRRFVERGADKEKLTVIPNVCEERIFHYAPDAPKYDFAGRFTIITHGLIENRYGHELVVKAVSNLKDRFPDIYFEIIGDGEYRSTIAALVQQLQCGEHVHFSGFVSENELLEKIRGADVGIIAMQRSPYSELIETNKMYEYIALRKPVIASHLPGIEQGFDSSCLLFFEPGNVEDLQRCIVKLYNNPHKRKELVKHAYARYEKIRWSETKKTYLKVVENLVGEKEG